MNTFSFRAILKPHKDSPKEIAGILQTLYDDVAVSTHQGEVYVTFVRKADSFSSMVLMSSHQLTELGYRIERIEIDGKVLPLSFIADADLCATQDLDLDDTDF